MRTANLRKLFFGQNLTKRQISTRRIAMVAFALLLAWVCCSPGTPTKRRSLDCSRLKHHQTPAHGQPRHTKCTPDQRILALNRR